MVKKKIDDWVPFLSRFTQEVVGGSTVMLGVLNLLPNLSNPHSVASSLLIIGAGKFLLPSVNEFVAEKWNIRIPIGLRIIAFVLLLVLAFGIVIYTPQSYWINSY
jgi:hypothetical protein